MLTLLAALSYCVGVGLGVSLPTLADPKVAPICAVGGALSALAAIGASRNTSTWLLIAALSLGVLRGRVGDPAPVVSEARGQAVSVSVTAGSASRPGPRCELELGDGLELALEQRGTACAIGSGTTLVLSADARRGPLGPVVPGETSAFSRRARMWRRLDSKPSVVSQWIAQRRAQAWEASRGDPQLGLVVAAGLGLRRSLPPGDRDALRAAGLGHLIAVSGLHVGVAALFLYFGLLRLGWLVGRGPAAASLVSMLPVAFYVVLTGAAPSAVRAAAMLAALALGVVLGRPAHGLTTLALVAAAMLAAFPSWAIDPGFQLSMAAMAAILTGPPGAGIVRHSWRVTWAITPVALLHFGHTSVYGLVTNVVAIPVFATWVLPAAVLGVLATPLWGLAAFEPARAGADLLLGLARVCAQLPRLGATHLPVLAALGLLAWWIVPGGRHERVRAWLPPRLALVGVLLAAWIGRASPSVRDYWYAVGSTRASSLIVPDADLPGDVCVDRPRSVPGRWLRTLDAIGARTVIAVRDDEAGEGRRLVAMLARTGRWDPRPHQCPQVDRQRAQLAVESCARRRGDTQALVRGRLEGERIECFSAGGWRLLASGGS